MSLDTSTHQCLSCCTTNVTTDDCCQCPSIWDGEEKDFFLKKIMFLFKGFCLHPLVSASTHSSLWWWKSPIDNIRNKFTELDRSHQTVVLVTLILIVIIASIGL